VSAPLIEVREVSKAFGGVVANQDISIDVIEGRITGLIGPNGSGKTTLFNSIAGYHPIDAGSIKFHGQEISKLNVQKIARLGMVRTFQQTRIYGKMDCVQNMLISVPHRTATWRDMFGRFDAKTNEKAERLLEFVGLYAKRHLLAGSLSFGQQKLLEFAMALMNEPRCSCSTNRRRESTRRSSTGSSTACAERTRSSASRCSSSSTTCA
jgi:branched-chain amino acid transport system ATP-binding protein